MIEIYVDNGLAANKVTRGIFGEWVELSLQQNAILSDGSLGAYDAHLLLFVESRSKK